MRRPVERPLEDPARPCSRRGGRAARPCGPSDRRTEARVSLTKDVGVVAVEVARDRCRARVESRRAARACERDAREGSGATLGGRGTARELELHRCAVGAAKAQRPAEPVERPAEARGEPAEEERALGAEASARVRRLHDPQRVDRLRERAAARVVEEARGHLLPGRRGASTRGRRSAGRVRVRSRAHRDQREEARERGVVGVEDDALRVARELAEDRIVDVDAAEPDERRRDLRHDEGLDRAADARAGGARGAERDALRADVAAALDAADGGHVAVERRRRRVRARSSRRSTRDGMRRA